MAAMVIRVMPEISRAPKGSPESKDARICTYECTFCVECVETVLKGVCPNCGGNFSPRPIRPANMLLKHPASTKRGEGGGMFEVGLLI